MAGLSTNRNRKQGFGLVGVLIALLVGSMIFGGVYYQKYQDLRQQSSKTAEERNKELIDKINQVYALPKDETPVVAIVSDEEKFKTEYPVFTTAKLGDTLLLFEKAAQAILFRESENKVIGTASFVVNKGASVHIIGSVDVQNSTQATLESKFAGKLTVGSKATSTNQLSGVTVFDKSGKNAELASQLATELGGVVVTSAPIGETIPDTAQVIITIGTQAGDAEQVSQ